MHFLVIFSHPLHISYLFGWRSLVSLHSQHSLQKVSKGLLLCPFQLVFAAIHQSLQLIVGLCFERMAALCYSKHYYSERPDIRLLAYVIFATDDFWSHVVGRAAYSSEFLLFVGWINAKLLRQLNPKSISLVFPLLISTFCSLMSLWTIFLECR